MNYEYGKLYLRPLGSTDAYSEFKYSIDGVHNGLPEHTKGANDVDRDSYTNMEGYTIRNRVRHDVATLDFTVPTMTGEELHSFFQYTTGVYFDAYFFFEPVWDFTSRTMYRSATVTYTPYYIDPSNPNNNIYNDVKFSFIEE